MTVSNLNRPSEAKIMEEFKTQAQDKIKSMMLQLTSLIPDLKATPATTYQSNVRVNKKFDDIEITMLYQDCDRVIKTRLNYTTGNGYLDVKSNALFDEFRIKLNDPYSKTDKPLYAQIRTELQGILTIAEQSKPVDVSQ